MTKVKDKVIVLPLDFGKVEVINTSVYNDVYPGKCLLEIFYYKKTKKKNQSETYKTYIFVSGVSRAPYKSLGLFFCSLLLSSFVTNF